MQFPFKYKSLLLKQKICLLIHHHVGIEQEVDDNPRVGLRADLSHQGWALLFLIPHLLPTRLCRALKSISLVWVGPVTGLIVLSSCGSFSKL